MSGRKFFLGRESLSKSDTAETRPDLAVSTSRAQPALPAPRRLICDTRSGQRYVVVGTRALKPHEAELGDAQTPGVHDTWRDPEGGLARHHVSLRKILAAKGWTLIESPAMPVAVVGAEPEPASDPEPAVEPVGMFEDLEDL